MIYYLLNHKNNKSDYDTVCMIEKNPDKSVIVSKSVNMLQE